MAEDHCHQCSAGSLATPSVHQSLDEMEFERGIWQAALDGDISRINSLISKGTDVNVKDNSGYTALHYAARQGNADVTGLLLQRNADPNATTKAGSLTPLHRAAYQGHVSIVRQLLEAGAKVDMCDADGKTALHKAAENNEPDTCRLLLKHSPQLVQITDKKGLKPCDVTSDDTLRILLADKR